MGLLTAIGLNFGFLAWLVGISAINGTAAIIYTLFASSGELPPRELLFDPVRLAIQNSFWWLLFFVVVAGVGVWVQLRANRYVEWSHLQGTPVESTSETKL